MPPVSPKSVAFWSSIAWSRSSARMMPSTGPKHSVRWNHDPGRTPILMPGRPEPAGVVERPRLEQPRLARVERR